MKPIYTADCEAAYQLRWSLAIFPKRPLPPVEYWLAPLQRATEPDGVRILECSAASTEKVVLFLLSTTPTVSVPTMVKSVKGRLRHTLKSVDDVEFRRNFRLTSVGAANLDVVQAYVANQLAQHPLACPYSSQAMTEFQLAFDEVDLSEPIRSKHGEYVTALHLVLVHAERWRIAEPAFLRVTRDAILDTATKKEHRISRLSIVPDHVHFTLGFGYRDSPSQVALSYMNNIAFRHGMMRMWMNSYYVGTLGPYDMRGIRANLS